VSFLIDDDFVPYAKRPVLRRNQDLFVDGGRGGGGGGGVAPAGSVSPACIYDWQCPAGTTCFGHHCG
jgi:hypothetical protein